MAIANSISTPIQGFSPKPLQNAIAFTPAELQKLIPALWPSVKDLVDRDATKNGGSGRLIVAKFSDARTEPRFAAQPQLVADVQGGSGNETPLITYNTAHPFFAKSTDKKMVEFIMVHEYLHAVSSKFQKTIIDLVSKRLDQGAPGVIDRANNFLAVINEGITDVLAEKLTGLNSPINTYTDARRLANYFIRELGIDTVKKAYYSGDAVSVEKMINLALKAVKFTQ